MVAFLRKVSALVVAAALILCTSVTAFAAAGFPFFTNARFYVRSPEAFTDSHSLNPPSTFFGPPLDSLEISANSNFDITLTCASANSGSVASNTNTYQVSFVLTSPDVISDLALDYVYLESFFGNASSGYSYVRLTDFTYDLSMSTRHDSSLAYYLITVTFSTKPEASYVDLGYMFRFSFNDDITVDRYTINSSLISSSYSSDAGQSIFEVIKEGFSNLLLFLRFDDYTKEDNYTSVTDPSTSQEIQDTQEMIDDVEDFEASLNQTITTEFNKIDFTTPTNLAAPVAYVGDKVTRSVNSLGNYQPLIFVPLTLGIMLIMLGRGVSALGSMVSSSSRAVSRNKSQGDDS